LLELLNGVFDLPFMSGRKLPLFDVPFVSAEPCAGCFDAVATTVGCFFSADVLAGDVGDGVGAFAGLAASADFCDPLVPAELRWLSVDDLVRLEVLDRLGLESAELGRVVLEDEGDVLLPLHGLGLEP
jgi:hypothetical protein